MEDSFNNCCSGIVLCYDDLAIYYYYFVFIYYVKNNYSKNSHSLD